MRKTDQRDGVIQHRGQIVGIQASRGRIDRPFANAHPVFRQSTPGAGIGLVILIGDDDRLAGPDPAPHRLGQNIGVLRSRRPERHLVPFHTQHLRKPRPRLVHLLAPQTRRLIGRVGLHLAVAIEPGQPVDDLPAGLGPARNLDKRLALKCLGGKSWKLLPYPFILK